MYILGNIPKHNQELIIEIKRIFARKNYVFFSSGNFDMNLIGVRSKEIDPNKFNDWGMMIFKDQYDELVVKTFRMTTDPGLIALQHHTAEGGTAIMLPGQYRGAFKLGFHKGRRALIQAGKFMIARDRNDNGRPDYHNIQVAPVTCGINFHDAPVKNLSAIKNVGKFSYGCQVIPDIHEFEYIFNMIKVSTKFYGPTITYTLLEEEDFLTEKDM